MFNTYSLARLPSDASGSYSHTEMRHPEASNKTMKSRTTIRAVEQFKTGIIVKTNNNQYAFPYVFGDQIRGGNKADLEGLVTYGGDSLQKHYISSNDFSEVPDDVIAAVGEHAVVAKGVDGGWSSWEGRPEWSDTFVDLSDVEIVASPGDS